MSDTPPPPPGYTLSSAAPPPPPPGYSLQDASPPPKAPAKASFWSQLGDAFADPIREYGKESAAAGQKFLKDATSSDKFPTQDAFRAQLLLDAADWAGSPISAAMTSVVGRPVETMTGGKIDRHTAGNIAMAALPFGEGLAAERAAATGAEALGVSKASAPAMMAGREAATAGLAKSRASAASAEQAAHGYVRRVMQSAKATPESIAEHPAFASGKPVTAAEAIGRPGINALGSLGRRAGATPDALESQLRTRAAAKPDRVLADYAKATGLDPAAVEGDFAAHAKQLRAKAAPLYEKAYAKGPIMSEKLKELSARPSVQKALHHAHSLAAEEGRSPESVGLIYKDAPLVIDGKPLVRPNGQPITTPQQVEIKEPTAQTWDYVKRGLDDVMEEHRDKTTGKLNLDTRGRATESTLHDLREELFNLNPDYKEALAAGGEPLRMEGAYKSAKKLMSPATSEANFTKSVEKMSPSEREALKAGLVNDAFVAARNGALKLKDTQQPAYRTKLEAVIGKEQTDQLLPLLQHELTLDSTGNRMMPGVGSVTSESLMSDAERTNVLGDAAIKFGGHAINHGARRATVNLLADLAKKAHAAATTPNEEEVRDIAGRLLMSSPDALATILARTPPE